MLTFLIISNSLINIYLLVKQLGLFLTFEKETTLYKTFVISYKIYLWKRINEYSSKCVLHLKIPIKNGKKAKLEEEILNMITQSEQSKRQKLGAMFSWLKTIEEVKDFERNYSVVDEKFVKRLVDDFKAKNIK